MPQWATFAGFAIVVTAGLLVLSHASRSLIDGQRSDSDERRRAAAETRDVNEETIVLPKSGVELRLRDSGGVDDDTEPNSVDATESNSIDATEPNSVDATERNDIEDDEPQPDSTGGGSMPELSTASLLANVAVSQGLFGLLLLAGAWYAEIPAWAFGLARDALTPETVLLGVGLGVALYVANEAGATVGGRFGLGDGERLRSALAPDSALGWAALLFVVLPIIAAFEELLFRGALVGVLAAGYDVSPWLLAFGSSAAFGVGHGAQGRIGVLVTGTLGFVLAAAFILTQSLLVVIVAHYLVNALEFVVHEGLGVDFR